MRFEDTYNHYQQGSLTQEEAASLLGVCARTFRRYIMRYKEEGLEGLIDRRISQLSHRMVPVDEVCRLTDLYRNEYYGWNVRHFYSWYQRQSGGRSYS